MIFESITLTNFRQFGGTQTVEFSTDKKKNVTFILARNGVGKTTILKAFIWCLYGINSFDQNNNLKIAQLAHIPATEKLSHGDKIQASVEIKFTDKDIEYAITRTAFYRKDSDGIVTDQQDELKLRKTDVTGISQYITDETEQKRVIEKILPQRLSKFFFFAGESISSEGIAFSKEHTIGEAIKGLLGLGYLENALQHLKDDKKDNVIKRFSKQFSNANGQLNVINEQIDKLDEDILKADEEISKLQTSIEETTDMLNKKNKEIQDNKGTEVLAERRNAYTQQLAKLREDHDKKVNDLQKTLNDYSYLFLLRSLVKEATEALHNRQDLDAGIPELSAPTVQHILQTGECICGTQINAAQEKKLTTLLKSIPPESIGTAISKFKQKCKDCLDDAKNFDTNVQNSIAEIATNNAEQRTTGDNLKDTENKIAETGGVDVSKLLEQYRLLSASLNKYESNLDIVKNKRKENTDAKTDLESRRTAIIDAGSKDATVNLRIQYANNIYDQVIQIYKDREREIRKELADLMMDKFELFHGTRYGIDFDADYNLLFTQNGKPVLMSGGQGVCIVFALVTSVIELRKKYVADKEPSEAIQNIIYPFVMDASTSNLDPESIESVCRNLPHLADQIIFMVDSSTPKEYFDAHIGGYYELKRGEDEKLYTQIERI